MTARRSRREARAAGAGTEAAWRRSAPARDVVEGIPDRTCRPAAWKYVLLALIFLAWVAFLVCLTILGRR